MKISRRSTLSGKMHTLELDVTHAQIQDWRRGGLIQDIMPLLTDDEREFLISGCTVGEWELFNEDQPRRTQEE